MKTFLPALLLSVVLAAPLPGRAATDGAVPVRLASGGRALLPVVTGPDADPRTTAAAADLAAMLGRISGASFTVVTGDGTRGLAVGEPADFPLLEPAVEFYGTPFAREDYLLQSHDEGAWLLGAGPTAVEHAVWDFLYRLGYRQFFPRDTWEVVPAEAELTVALAVRESPDYYSRRIWSGGSLWNFNREPFAQWLTRNRAGQGLNLRTSHAYGSIIRANQAAFDANPDYYAKVDGQRRWRGGNTKFCIGNPGLRELVVGHAVAELTAHPERDSISMDPSDGGNWCECADCEALGSVSDRVVVLANEVAAAINALGLGDKYVGIYAYASHSPPPAIRVHPKVVVSVATSYIRGGYTAMELVSGWAERGALIGLREYYSITIWSRDLPGAARASDFSYLGRTIPEFHAAGARFNSANITDSWGPCGPGFYLIARLLWDVAEADRIPELLDDFFVRAFGPAREPAERFYRLINRFDPDDRRPLLSEHLVGRMYRELDAARRLAGEDERIRERLDDLVLYTRFVDLYLRADNARGAERQALAEAWVEHAYAIRRRMMVHSRALSARRLPAGTRWPDEERLAAFQAAPDYTPGQVAELLAEGIAVNQLLDFEPVEFSDELVPAASLGLAAPRPGAFGHNNIHRSSPVFSIWVDEPGEIRLRVTGGITYQNRGNVTLRLYSPLAETGEPVAVDESVPPDQVEREVILKTPFAGRHTLRVNDGDARHRIAFPAEMPVAVGPDFQPQVGFDLYFYVPRGTRVIGGYVDSREGGLFGPDGETVYSFAEGVSRGYFNVAVPAGADGALWRARTWRGRAQLRLMTVPPWLARDGQQLLLPAEVVAADGDPGL